MICYQQMHVLIYPYLKRKTLYHTCCWLTGAFWRNSELSIFVLVTVAADLECRTMKQNVTHRAEGWVLLEPTYRPYVSRMNDRIGCHLYTLALEQARAVCETLLCWLQFLPVYCFYRRPG
jgi:hypothetical protein